MRKKTKFGFGEFLVMIGVGFSITLIGLLIVWGANFIIAESLLISINGYTYKYNSIEHIGDRWIEFRDKEGVLVAKSNGRYSMRNTSNSLKLKRAQQEIKRECRKAILER